MKSRRSLSRFVLAALVALCAGFRATSACSPPGYRTGEIVTAKGSVTANITVKLAAFAPEHLVCLADALKRKYSGLNIDAFIFSSAKAMRNYSPSSIEVTPQLLENQRHLKGRYYYNNQTHEEYFVTSPDGLGEKDSPLRNRINLPLTKKPECSIEVHGRCLLELRHIYYPSSIERKVGVSGVVTVNGQIRQDGSVSRLVVSDARVSPLELETVLVDVVTRNLNTWRFEPSKDEDDLRITYEFDGIQSPLVGGARTRFRLPFGISSTVRPQR